MVKLDERRLWDEFKSRTNNGENFFHLRALAQELGIPERRAESICLKWAGRDWIDYDIHVLVGSLTEKGRNAELPD